MLKTKTIQTQVIINRPINAVWDTLCDFEKYPVWNPFLIQVEKVAPHRLKIMTHMNEKKMRFSPKILQMNPPFELRWIGQLLDVSWLFQGEHYFLLSSPSPSKTQVVHGESFSGLLVTIGWRFMQKQLHESFSRMNASLKEVCEK